MALFGLATLCGMSNGNSPSKFCIICKMQHLAVANSASVRIILLSRLRPFATCHMSPATRQKAKCRPRGSNKHFPYFQIQHQLNNLFFFSFIFLLGVASLCEPQHRQLPHGNYFNMSNKKYS